MKYIIDYEALQNFLEGLSKKDIETTFYKPENPLLAEGDKIDYCLKYEPTTPLNKVIQYGQPFLVDLLGNDLSVCVLTKRKYKAPDGRVVGCKFVKTIIKDCCKIYGSSLNGYWIIPQQFITLKK